MREWLAVWFREITPFIIIVAFVMFEATGVEYSQLFVAALTASLGIEGINIYGKVRR